MRRNALFPPASALAVTALTLVTLATARPARAVELLTNGNFETGDFTGWFTAAKPGGIGSFVIDQPGTPLPGGTVVDRFPTSPNALPGGGGNFYAVSSPPPGSDGGGGAHALYQTFAVPTGPIASLTLRFQMFVNDYGNFGSAIPPGAPPNDLFSYFDSNLNPFGDPIQFGSVDLLNSGAPVFSTAAADVRRTFYRSVDMEQGQARPYVQYEFNIAANVTAGQSYTLRFGDVQNVAVIALGVDNVSINYVSGASAIPEPGAGWLCLLVLAFGLGVGRMRSEVSEEGGAR
jgi:hypothetical protein